MDLFLHCTFLSQTASRDPRVGERIESSQSPITFPVGKALTGRVVNALGQPIDGKGPLVDDEESSSTELMQVPLLQATPIPLNARAVVTKPFHTGVKAVDIMHPTAYGNRLAVIGSRGTGKSTLATSIITNQVQWKTLTNTILLETVIIVHQN